MSYRLGGTDGVSVEAAKWQWALGELGLRVVTVAGEGEADRIVPGLRWRGSALPAAEGAPGERPAPSDERSAREAGTAFTNADGRLLDDALAGIDLVVVENMASLPLNPEAAREVVDRIHGRRAVLHHHDLASQRPGSAHHGPPENDELWLHVTINEVSRHELAAAGIHAVTIRNTFDPDPPPGRRVEMRSAAGAGTSTILLLQPTRALPRKNVDGAVEAAAAVARRAPGRTVVYWLLGPAEDGYARALDAILDRCPVPVLRGFPPGGPWEMSDAYAASDAVLLPSTWEGFGNPAVESAVHGKPLLIGDYPVARELAGFGFRWFPAASPDLLASHLLAPDAALLEHNRRLARRDFCLADLPERLARAFERRGWHDLTG